MQNIENYLNENLSCPICYELAYNNLECESCSTIFCTNCIKKVYDYNTQNDEIKIKCPHCRLESDFYHNKLASKILSQCQINCEHCNIKVIREKLSDHLDICIGKIEECKKCKQLDRKKVHKCIYNFCNMCENFYIDEIKHKYTCPKNIINCEFCFKQYKFEDEIEHLCTTCEVYPVQCQFCNIYSIRDEIINHYLTCNKFKVECKVCGEKYTNRDGHNCEFRKCPSCLLLYKKGQREYHDKNICDRNKPLYIDEDDDIAFPIDNW